MKAQLEPLLDPFGRLLVSKRILLPAFNHPFHFHPEIELTHINRSNGTCVIGDHVGSFQPGDLYLLGANLPHVFRNTIPPKKKAEAEVLHFSLEQVEANFGRMPEMREFRDLMERSRRCKVFDREVSVGAALLLRRVRESHGVKRLAVFFELMDTLIKATKPRLLASVGYSPRASSLTASNRIHRACNFVLKEFKEEIRHKEISRRVNLTPAAFSRLFRRTTRKTFTEFVTEVRLGHACRLLRDRNLTVAEIAFESGFNNLSNFNRRFRRVHGCSPSEYRTVLAGATA